ncbi:MAG: UDP-N-acetylmuramoyl-tripeptide--D-alanyl-D-alanine ligase [Gemmatimonadota bacterium]|nr:UDP-N-acetylmuramoyl-tripeptide--D-alanyl-D-alanine ligase [Gemmatimonadota bacterium]
MTDLIAAAPSTAFWTLDRVARALGAPSSAPHGASMLRGVSTDTRSVSLGDVFVALVGERFDAHRFLEEAVAAGAAALVVSRAPGIGELGVPVFEVPDTLIALGNLARFRRRALGVPVVAIAGSNGKTSTKEIVRAALGAVLHVHATTANLNNLIGVPLTLLAAPNDCDVIVVELGTNAHGEVARLRAIAEPDVAVVTSIGEEHLEGFGSLEGVLREESEVFSSSTVAIVPADQPEIGEAARSRSRRVVEAGLDTGDMRAQQWGLEPDGRGWISIDGDVVRPPLRGAHNLRNTMLALAVARECGVSMADAARGIAGMPVPAMRTAFASLGRLTLINDAYNANPASMRAALDLLEGTGAGRQRVAVLGTMLELGAHAKALHAEIARRALRSSVDVIAATGEMAEALVAAAAGDASGRLVIAPTVDALWPALEPRLTPDAVVLLKASRGIRLERLVPHLTAWATR